MDFYMRTLLVCREIPPGRVATYGQIALLCGKPQNSRQVGYALNKKFKNEEVCAFRVVNAQGKLTGAAAFPTFDTQEMLLAGEGVEVTEGRVDLKKYGWMNTMEDAIRLRKQFEALGI